MADEEDSLLFSDFFQRLCISNFALIDTGEY